MKSILHPVHSDVIIGPARAHGNRLYDTYTFLLVLQMKTIASKTHCFQKPDYYELALKRKIVI